MRGTLLHASTRREYLTEAHRIRLAHYLEPQTLVQRKSCLVKQPVNTRAAGLAGGIQAHAGFAHPRQQGAYPRSERSRHVRNTRTRLRNYAVHTTDGDMGEHWPHPEALLVGYHEGPVYNIDLALLDEDDRHALHDEDGFEE